MEENAEAPRAPRAGRRARPANEGAEGSTNDGGEDSRSFAPRQGGFMEEAPSSASGADGGGARTSGSGRGQTALFDTIVTRPSTSGEGPDSSSANAVSATGGEGGGGDASVNGDSAGGAGTGRASGSGNGGGGTSGSGGGSGGGGGTGATSGRRREAGVRPVVSFAAAVDDPLGDGEGGDKKFSGVSRRKQEQMARSDETVQRNKKYDEATEDVLDIPELEEEGKEDLSSVVAEAPRVRSNKIQGMDELEEEVTFRLPATGDRDVDLSLLTAVLCLSEQVREGDEVWDPELLLGEVASELNAEKERAEAADAPPGEAGGSTNPMYEAEAEFTAGGGSAMTSSARVP